MAVSGSSLQGSGLYLGNAPAPQKSTNTVQTTTRGTVTQPALGAAINQGPLNIGGVINGVSTGGATAPAVDPWAGTPWGSAAAHTSAVNDYNSARDNAYGSITDLTNDTGAKYNSGILDFIDQLKSGQRNIDRSAVQNELARDQGRAGVLDMVGTGIRSGGVVLNNAGGANSSAGEAISKAYGDLGRRELTTVGNQYEVGNENIKGQQDDLNAGTATFRRHTEESKVSAVNSIVQTASDQLARLNAAAQSASLPDRIAIEQEKARIRNDAMAKLTEFDATLNAGISGTAPRSVEGNRVEAQRLLTAGTAPDNSFDFTTSIPAQFQNTGPFASTLPIFTGKRRELQGA